MKATPTPSHLSLDAYFKEYQAQIESFLEQKLPKADSQNTTQAGRLIKAIRYATLDGGKRIRPILCLATCTALQGDMSAALCAGSALELIHVYSLIHDDLPAMDDDDLRRGKPSCHKAFDEATAILAGDALQALAFEWLSELNGIAPEQRLNMIKTLAKASGVNGMVGGQALDLAATGKQQTIEQLENMHLHKTGALIEAAILLGAYCSSSLPDQQVDALKKYSRSIGLAFQVQDDILDIISDTEILGKPQGTDIASNKSTYPALLGLDGAKALAKQLHQEALLALNELGFENAGVQRLREISQFIIARKC